MAIGTEITANIERMGESLGTVHHNLTVIVRALHIRLHYFTSLYKDTDNCKILHAAAKQYFLTTKAVYMDSIILGICRITEERKDKHNNKLTFKRLLHELRNANPCKDLEREATNLNSSLHSKISPFKKFRDNYIAHLNFEKNITLSSYEDDASQMLYSNVVATVKDMHEILNLIYRHYFQLEIDFNKLASDVSAKYGPEKLIHALKNGLQPSHIEI